MKVFWGKCDCDTKFPHYCAFSDDPPVEVWADSAAEAYVLLRKELGDVHGIKEIPPPVEFPGIASLARYQESLRACGAT